MRAGESMQQLPSNPRAGSADALGMDLSSLLQSAVEQGASDLHLKMGQPPVIRHDGSLRPLEGWPELGPGQLDIFLHDVCRSAPARLTAFQASGELDTAYQPAGLPRFRVNVFRQRGDVSFAFRVIPSNVPTFDSLRIPQGVQNLVEENRGLILVTGATGVGKTTTLASMLGHINRTRRQHIVTIEDPIEILHSDESCLVSQ
jgi:twitching motility protein PilT